MAFLALVEQIKEFKLKNLADQFLVTKVKINSTLFTITLAAGYNLQLYAGHTQIISSMNEQSVIEKLVAKSLANTIRQRRQELHLSQEKVALRASLDRSHYQVIEAGLGSRKTLSPANPRLNTLLHIAESLDCTLVDLLQETSDAFEKFRISRKY